MKQWTNIKLSSDFTDTSSYIKDIYRSEILDTRIVISNLFTEARLMKNSETVRIKGQKIKSIPKT